MGAKKNRLWYTRPVKRSLLSKALPAAGLILALGLILLAVLRLLAAGGSGGARAFPPPENRAEAGVRALAVYTHGEALHLGLADGEGREFLAKSLRLESLDQSRIFDIAYGEGLNRGLFLPDIPPGSYRLFYQGRAVLAGETPLTEGYTLTRNGANQHWRFLNSRGRLQLEVAQVDELPPSVYDVYIDIGHGGRDSGAVGNGLVEAEQNLKAGLYLAQLLEGLGLKVYLSRETMAIPGGEAAEQNPYSPGARVDMLYRSQAKYLISNHLNAGGGHGFQLYTSVATDKSFAQAVAAQLLAAGWIADEEGFGPLGNGLYKRRSEVYSQALRDYYFIIRETGGYLLSPWQYRLQNREQNRLIYQGAEALLVEYAFLDNAEDTAYWQENWQALVEAVAQGAADYWRLAGE